MTTDEIAAAIEANMPGVTPGEWKAENRESMLSGYGQRANVGVWSQARYDRAAESEDEDDDPEDSAWLLGIWGVISDEDYANAAHIALTSPANMAALLSERKAMRDEIERLREYYEAREDIARVGLFDATSAQWDRLNTITAALKETAND